MRKIASIVLLLTFSINVFADTSSIISKKAIDHLDKHFPNININHLSLPPGEALETALKVAEILFHSNDRALVYEAEQLLKNYERSHSIALLQLSIKYLEGVDVISDKGEAINILRDYKKAEEYSLRYLSDPLPSDELYLIAFVILGTSYMKTEDYENAAHLFLNNLQLVEAESSGQSAFDLATLYREGDGVSKNLEEAYYWYDIASKKGLNMAIMERNFLALELEKE